MKFPLRNGKICWFSKESQMDIKAVVNKVIPKISFNQMHRPHYVLTSFFSPIKKKYRMSYFWNLAFETYCIDFFLLCNQTHICFPKICLVLSELHTLTSLISVQSLITYKIYCTHIREARVIYNQRSKSSKHVCRKMKIQIFHVIKMNRSKIITTFIDWFVFMN